MTQRTIAIAAATLVGLLLVIIIGTAIFISAGAYNVAATEPHSGVEEWLMNRTKTRSVAARADEIPSPPPADSTMVLHGFEEYHEMCVICHGAPGVERGAFGQGMNPEPPDLSEVASEWSDRELFWITKYGLKLAGMPAFGVTHSDRNIWSIVAFVRRLERMSAQEYRRLAAGAAPGHPAMAEMAAAPTGAGAQPHAAAHGTAAASRAPLQDADHAVMDHSGAVAATPRPAHAQGHDAMPERDHPPMPGHAPTVEPHAAKPAHDIPETEATTKLKILAAELLRDPTVQARIKADSALRHEWQKGNIRKQLLDSRAHNYVYRQVE